MNPTPFHSPVERSTPWPGFHPLGLFILLLSLPAWNSAEAATRVWKGGGPTTHWSLSENWENGIPQEGDSLQFNKHPLGFSVTAINDLTNIALTKITSEAQGYTITGGDLRLISGIEVTANNPNGSINISCPLHLVGPTINFIATPGNGIGLQGTRLFAAATSRVILRGQVNLRPAPGSRYLAATEIRDGSMALVNAPQSVGGPIVVGGEDSGAALVLQSNFLLFNEPPLSILKNGTLNNIATLNTIGRLKVDGGRIILGGTSPNGRISVVGDALFENEAQIVANAFSSGIPGELSITGLVTIARCTLLIQNSVQLTNSAVIIRNDGTDRVNGTFRDLPEGTILAVGNKLLQITYQGGDGNDVALIPRGNVLLESIVPSTSHPGGFLIQGITGTNQTVTIESVDDLSDSPLNWVKRGETLSDALQGRFDFLDSPTPQRSRFYRAVIP